jgi:large subunit ribosomal protein L10
MPKPEKVEKVKELTNRFKSANGAIFADYRGLTVKDITELRRILGDSGTSLAVVKNTLTRLAVRSAGLDEAVELLEGPTAVAFMQGDALQVAKALLDVSRRYPALGVKGALIDGHVLGPEDARSLATVERREVSMAKLAGLLQAPVARIIYLLQAPLKRIAYALSVKGAMMGPESEGESEGREAEGQEGQGEENDQAVS